MMKIFSITALTSHFIDFIWPADCVECGTRLAKREGVGFCPECWQKLPWWDRSKIAAPPLPKGVDAFYAPFVYEGVVRELILALKFADQTYLKAVFAPFIARHIPDKNHALLVPVPVHNKRLRRRLFNQTGEVAQAVADVIGVKAVLHGALQKVKHVRAQSQQTAKQRRQLAVNTFEANENYVSGQHIILLDDIWTTGSTASACARALKQAGAARVTVVTIAYAALTSEKQFLEKESLHQSEESGKNISFW